MQGVDFIRTAAPKAQGTHGALPATGPKADGAFCPMNVRSDMALFFPVVPLQTDWITGHMANRPPLLIEREQWTAPEQRGGAGCSIFNR